MECSRCLNQRCSFEFPRPSSRCKHPPSVCLTCLDDLLPANCIAGTCPECNQSLSAEDICDNRKAMKNCNRECSVFHELDLIQEKEEQARKQGELDVESGYSEGTVEVSLIDGSRYALSVTSKMRISEVKRRIKDLCGVPEGKQRLSFCKRDIEVNSVEHDPRWSSVGVPFGEVVQLVIIMYETGSGVCARMLSFELSWTACSTRPLHLNGTCIVLDRVSDVLAEVDFRRTDFRGIAHAGPSSRGNPRQVITVDTDQLPDSCCYLTLSSFEGPSVGLKNAISMEMLASYKAGSYRHAEAIVLCCAARHPASGEWRVQQIGKPSDGNWKCYEPLHTTLRHLVSDGQVL